MDQATESKAVKKAPTEIETVQMNDGRSVDFPGKRKLQKEVIIEEGNSAAVRFDFRNGETRLFKVPSAMLYQFAAHGASQKIGDEASGDEDVEDMVLHIDNLIERLNSGDWAIRRAAGESFAGASVVIKAICEASGKSLGEVKAFLQRKLDEAEASGQKLTRASLYASFRNPNSKVGQIIERLERDKKAKAAVLDADELLAEV
ncbi:MAG: hypothetical protein KGL39_09920 [Patescibacteria group bacterium]|nr:hypothetical protein [Patescibacteria group bacterium]